MVEDDPVALTDSPQLECVTPKSQDNQISKMADLTSNSKQQCVVNISLALNNKSPDDNNMFNMQFEL